jgi:hypothetical protein
MWRIAHRAFHTGAAEQRGLKKKRCRIGSVFSASALVGAGRQELIMCD